MKLALIGGCVDFIQNLDIDNDAAVVLQLGVERRINNRISLFADAKKAFYRTQAFGNIGPVPVRADVTSIRPSSYSVSNTISNP